MIGVVLILCYQICAVSSQIPKYLYDTNSQVQNILYDDSNKRVFVGGTNQILRLSVSIKYYHFLIRHMHFFPDYNKSEIIFAFNYILRCDATISNLKLTFVLFQDVLEVLNNKATGPVQDNFDCYYTRCTENDPKDQMDNVNKVSQA